MIRTTTPTAQMTEATTPTAQMTEATTPTAQMTEATEPTATEATTPAAQMTEATEPTETEATTPTTQMTEATTPAAQMTEATHQWTPVEDEALIALREFRSSAWDFVAEVFLCHPTECQERYTYLRNQPTEWTRRQNRTLQLALRKWPDNWESAAKQLDRAADSCRSHYEHMRKIVEGVMTPKKGAVKRQWTLQEESQLLAAYEVYRVYQWKWYYIAKHLKDRNSEVCYMHWKQRKAWTQRKAWKAWIQRKA